MSKSSSAGGGLFGGAVSKPGGLFGAGSKPATGSLFGNPDGKGPFAGMSKVASGPG